MKRVYLHLGAHKTGTSFVQSVLRRNVETLRKRGVRVVIGAESKSFLHQVDPKAVLTDWMDSDAGTVVFSNENFVLVENPRRLQLARELRDTLIGAGNDVTTIFYVRPATEWIPSMWAQYVKIASRNYGALTLDEFIDRFDYHSVLDAMASLRSESNTIIRPYLRSAMKNESIFDDFFETIGTTTDGIDAQVDRINATPSRRQIDLARVYNLHRPTGSNSRERQVQLLDSFLRARSYRDRSPSITATITKNQLRRIAERYAEAEVDLTNGAIDSRLGLPELLDRAPDTYEPAVSADAVDLYLQKMMILSKLETMQAPPDSTA